ncbi:hypothetical protein E0Z10_g5627 [Xylaria hypoxylon]|uniref:Protein kinase domain-containing protein n=1 Tax=Xylaria hypoxylon TaxID=37992 RepID=A0A4Z0Z0I0_9PEZI|nr:hypothetical protein E0Z10_g5627 [Xylaria hypoxylon]
MADETVEAGSEPKPTVKGFEYLEEWSYSCSLMIYFAYHGARFSVLSSSEADRLPQGYDLSLSIEGKILLELETLSFGTPTEEKAGKIDELQYKLAGLASAVCFPLIREIAPHNPLPEPRTLEEELYPPTYVLQIITKGDKLTSQKIDYQSPERYPPVSEQQLREIALGIETPVYHPSNVVLISRIQSLVWKVKVDGEMMICKVSMHPFFGPTLANELGVYQKIRQLGDELKLPKLKGIRSLNDTIILLSTKLTAHTIFIGVVKSHTGIIAVLLSYIPHKHHSLGMILDYTKAGRLPETEASTAMRTKWAEQIKHSVTRLHELGILWCDVKTDNVLIDNEGDAVVLDFGGGNTVGWVDQDKYGTLEGDLLGLEKIMAALREE